MATQIHGLEPALRRMRAIGNDKTVKRIARKAMRQAMNIARDAARQKVKRLDDPTTPEKSGKKLWFKMAGVEIKHFGYARGSAWWRTYPIYKQRSK